MASKQAKPGVSPSHASSMLPSPLLSQMRATSYGDEASMTAGPADPFT